MKARIIITPKKAVFDPQGKTVQNTLEHFGHQGISAVHVGKFLEVEISGEEDVEAVRARMDEACRRFLTNPVIEDYTLDIIPS
jgi:phosphoribosylformylglycinamidine synthase